MTARLVAMLHVHSTTALLDTAHAAVLGVRPPSLAERAALGEAHAALRAAWSSLPQRHPVLGEAVTSPLALDAAAVAPVRSAVARLPFVASLVERALREAAILAHAGVRAACIENAGPPYRMGRDALVDDALVLDAVATAVRAAHPRLDLGMQLLAGGELTALPLAIDAGASFVRSEASLFTGTRPEGPTENRGSLATAYLLRSVLTGLRGDVPPTPRRPAVWVDVRKKHTHFAEPLRSLDTWLDTVTFSKLEGVVVTGPHTGRDVAEDDLRAARTGLDRMLDEARARIGAGLPAVPLVTGSGTALAMYARYADRVIAGTALKRGGHWENELDRAAVERALALVGG